MVMLPFKKQPQEWGQGEEMKKYMKVEQLKHLNQFLLEDEKMVIFQSYYSTIAIYDKENDILTLGINWDYSTTTSRHLNIFIDLLFNNGYSKSQYKELVRDLNWKTRKKNVIKKWINENKIVFDKEVI